MDDNEFKTVLNDWLEIFDKKYTTLRVDIPSRPFMATHEFFDNAILDVKNSTKEEQTKPPFFRYWYDLVYEWFFKKYGAALKKDTEADYIKSFVIIWNMPYFISIPKNIIQKENDKQYRLIYPNNVHDSEDVLKWIQNSPNICNNMKKTIQDSIIEKVDLLRNININLMSTHIGDDECDNMLKSILAQLNSLAQDVVNSKRKIFSDSI